MNVCEALLDILADHGVKYIFGIPGDAINELIEAIRKQEKIKFIHVMHEESGAFAAGAQAKLSGELAVCVGTAGPGAIHLLNGLYDAKMDHAPVLAITGQVETSLIGTGYQQEVNLQALFENVTVYDQTIIDPAQMPEVAILAIQTAIAKKGVSHLSIPTNISTQKVVNYEKLKQAIHNSVLSRPADSELTKAAELINKAVRPCILAGIGARNAVPELLMLAEKIKAPVIKALRGKDILPDVHPYVLGGTGLLGTEPSYNATKHCDIFIVIGSDLPYHDFYPDHSIPTIQIEKEAAQVGRRHPVDVALIGDSKITIAELLPFLHINSNDTFLKNAQEEMKKWLEKQDKIELSKDEPIHPQAVARCISEYADDDAIIACDTGAVTVWGARNFRIKGKQQFTVSGGLASMAFGLPAAIGAKLLHPGRQVIALCGDGGFGMLMADFATAVKYRLNIKVFVFNNSKLGLIQIEEEAGGHPEYETSLHNPDYAAFAKICGGDGITITDAYQLDESVRNALLHNGPTLINVFVNPKELTWPPKITLQEAFNYSKAKLTELFS